MDPARYLAIDQGGQSSRALVLGAGGQILGEGRAAVATRRPRPGWVEHDAGELLRSVRAALEQAWRAAGGGPIRAAGLATQRSTLLCWDRRSGRPLSPALSWQDRRNAGLVARLATHEPRVRALTGLPLSAHYGASKLAWCLEQLPPVRRALGAGRLACGPLATYLLGRLLRERPYLVDPANAARTLLWDLEQRDWSSELAALFGIPAGVLPSCVATEYPYGTLNLGRRVPLTVCTGDQSAVPFAAGPPDPSACYLNLGTGAFLQRPTGHSRPQTGPLLAGILHSRDGQPMYVIEGTVNGAGSALELFDELPPGDGPEVDVPLFLNGVSGLGSPWWRADFAPRFIGRAGRGARRRAVLESIAFLLQVNLQEIHRHTGAVARLVATGGLAADDGLCAMLANLSRLPVERPVAQEATALGLGALLARLPEFWRGATVKRFEPRSDPPLAERFERWQGAMQRALREG